MIFTALVYLLILSLPLGQFGRIALRPGINFYIHDLIVIAILGVGIVKLIRSRKFRRPKLGKPLALFTGAMMLSLLVSFTHARPVEIMLGSLYFWRYLAYAGIYVLLAQPHLLTQKQKLNIPKLLIIAGFMGAVAGLVQYILLPDTRFLLATYWDEHYYRVLGPWLDPGFTGIIFVLTIILALNSRHLFSRNTYYIILTTCFAALMLTYSRASYLSLAAGVTMMGLLKRSPVLILSCYAAMLLAILIMPRPGGEGVKLTRTQSIVNRISYSQKVLPLIAKNPVVGVGFDLLRYKKHDAGVMEDDWQSTHAGAGIDNSFMFVLATTGIVGLIAYLWLITSQLLQAASYKLQASLPSLIAVLVGAQFNNTLFYAWIMLWSWVLWGAEE